MAKFQLSITPSYFRGESGWTKSALVREVVSNARDAVVMHGCDMTVEHRGTKLVVTTRGATLSRRNMLMGGGDKRGVEEAIGEHSEGLKGAMAVAARDGIPLRLLTGDEIWKPSITASAAFDGAEVLTINVAKASEYLDGVVVEIGKVSAAEWAAEKKNYLFLQDDAQVQRQSGASNTYVLTHASQRGRVYVKGVFVQMMDDLAYGYDLLSAKVDRDRRMVDSWDARYQMTDALAALSARDAKAAKVLYSQAKANRGDGAGYTLRYIGGTALDAVLAEFDAEHGADTIACSTSEEASKLRYLGRNAAVVPERLREAIEQRRGRAAAKVAELLSAPVKTIPRGELTAREAEALDMAVEVVRDAGYDLTVDVVEFHDKRTLGQFTTGTGMISVARSALAKSSSVLRVLVHELGHRESGATDGTVAHTQAVEEIWQAVWERSFGR
jgi:hypothetical protein